MDVYLGVLNVLAEGAGYSNVQVSPRVTETTPTPPQTEPSGHEQVYSLTPLTFLFNCSQNSKTTGGDVKTFFENMGLFLVMLESLFFKIYSENQDYIVAHLIGIILIVQLVDT